MKLTRIATILLPTIIVWLITAIFLLLYAFELLYEVFPSDFFSIGILLLFITACFATLALYFTGYYIDKKPFILRQMIILSLFISGIALFLVVIGAGTILLLLFIGLPCLGVSLGMLATSAGTLYTGYSKIDKRGRTYSIAIVISALLSLVPIPILTILKLDFRIHLVFLGLLSLIAAIIFYFISQDLEPWENDPFPTPLHRIIDRRPVKAYLSAHFFIYLMIGIAFATISESFGEFAIYQNKVFWILVFFGDLIFILPMGLFSDKIGRKKIMVIGCYNILFAALFVGLGTDEFSYYVSAFLLGSGFAAMHPTIDSAVWADLSPLDSLGRYNALGFIFLLQGVGCGLAIGLFAPSMILQLKDLSNISYILIGIAILGLFPLFFVADSYEPLDIYLLLVSTSGILIFNHNFRRRQEISRKDLTLVTGALSAIGIIFDETIHEKEAALDLVRHGNLFIVQAKVSLSDKDIIGTVFTNKNDPELHRSLKTFLYHFYENYKTELDTWVGKTSIFSQAIDIAEDVFGPLMPSQTLSGILDE